MASSVRFAFLLVRYGRRPNAPYGNTLGAGTAAKLERLGVSTKLGNAQSFDVSFSASDVAQRQALIRLEQRIAKNVHARLDTEARCVARHHITSSYFRRPVCNSDRVVLVEGRGLEMEVRGRRLR